jgi:hypothetical protein
VVGDVQLFLSRIEPEQGLTSPSRTVENGIPTTTNNQPSRDNDGTSSCSAACPYSSTRCLFCVVDKACKETTGAPQTTASSSTCLSPVYIARVARPDEASTADAEVLALPIRKCLFPNEQLACAQAFPSSKGQASWTERVFTSFLPPFALHSTYLYLLGSLL